MKYILILILLVPFVGKAYCQIKTLTHMQKDKKEVEVREGLTSHETFLIGFNKESQVVFFKSYEYIKEKEQCQADCQWVSENCAFWELGAATEWKLTHEERRHDIIIPHP